MTIIGWVFLLSSRDKLRKVLSAIDRSKDIIVEHFGLIEDTLITKDGRSIGEKGRRFFVIMPNSYGVEEVDKIIEQDPLSRDFVVRLDELEDEELEDTDDKGLIVKKIEYLDEFEFYEVSQI